MGDVVQMFKNEPAKVDEYMSTFRCGDVMIYVQQCAGPRGSYYEVRVELMDESYDAAEYEFDASDFSYNDADLARMGVTRALCDLKKCSTSDEMYDTLFRISESVSYYKHSKDILYIKEER